MQSKSIKVDITIKYFKTSFLKKLLLISTQEHIQNYKYCINKPII